MPVPQRDPNSGATVFIPTYEEKSFRAMRRDMLSEIEEMKRLNEITRTLHKQLEKERGADLGNRTNK